MLQMKRAEEDLGEYVRGRIIHLSGYMMQRGSSFGQEVYKCQRKTETELRF